jgi:hypothetical protein
VTLQLARLFQFFAAADSVVYPLPAMAPHSSHSTWK